MARATNPHLPTGAYILHALPDAERAEFETHLSTCRGCADEVAELTETAARLGSAVDHVVPTRLRSEVLHVIRRARQVPPKSQVGRVFSRRQGFRHAAAIISAACVVAAAVAGAHGALPTSTITPLAASPHTQIGDLLAAEDLRLVTAREPAATAAISPGRDEMLFLAHDLPTLSRDHVYQLWTVDERGPRPAGIVRPGSEVTSLLVSGIKRAGEAVLTVEPMGGSPSPTGAQVLSIDLR